MDRVVNTISGFIDFVDAKYNVINEEWNNKRVDKGINLRQRYVKDMFLDYKDGTFRFNSSYLIEIIEYRDFLSEKFLKGDLDNEDENFPGDGSTPVLIRTKNHNSIISKVLTYRFVRIEFGAVPLNKCLNDILGYRFILPVDLSDFNISTLVKALQSHCDSKCLNRCKVRDSSKPTETGVYRALHINIDKDNYSFPWEIQIWSKENFVENYSLHHQHKQDYIQWENSLSNTTIVKNAIIE